MREFIRSNFWTFALGALVVGVAFLAAREHFVEVPLHEESLSDLGTHLATAVFAALVIERAVEVIVSNRYSNPKSDALAAVRRARAEVAARKAAMKAAQEANAPLADYEKALAEAGDTLALAQRESAAPLEAVRRAKSHSAALLAVGFGLAAACVGMRIFGPFLLDGEGELIAAFQGDEHALQLAWFRFTDIVLSAVILAGGADGIHKIISAMKGDPMES